MTNFLKVFLSIVSIIMLSNSCKKSECPYEIKSSTNLYISYEINGEKHKYYQSLLTGGLYLLKYNSLFYQIDCFCGFGDIFNEKPEKGIGGSIVNLDFLRYQIFNNLEELSLSSLHDAVLIGKYKFTKKYHSQEYIPDNAIFMDGVSLSIYDSSTNTIYSTNNIIEYYEYDSIKIYNDILNPVESYLTVNSIKKVCDYAYLVQGEFATRLMKTQPVEMIEVKNGNFQFLIPIPNYK